VPEDGPLYALLVYGKGERADMSPAQRRMVVGMVSALKQTRTR
jgi:hypothetical protein